MNGPDRDGSFPDNAYHLTKGPRVSPVNTLKSAIRETIRACGLSIQRYPNVFDPPCVRQIIMRTLGINLVLDVGANVGQYSTEIFREGYQGRVISFEPVQSFYQPLEAKSKSNSRWTVRPLALGDTDTNSVIHVAGTMSSLLEKSETASGAVDFKSERDETIQVARLDTIRQSLFGDSDRVWMKLDVQGFEMNVLRGAAESLPKLVAVEMEMSLWPAYKGQNLYREMIDFMEARGFEVVSLVPNARNTSTGRMVEIDGIFCRKGELPA